MFYNTEPRGDGLTLFRAKQEQAERIRFRQSTGWNLSRAREFVRQAAEWILWSNPRHAELCLRFEPACEMPFG
jgi:hypothetical protein